MARTTLRGAIGVSKSSNSNIWFARQPSRRPARLRLFCLPYAGGGAGIYRNYSQEIPDDVEVCAIRLPGREKRFSEPAYRSVGPLVEAMADALRNDVDLPFVIFGHSLGALVGFELSRQLRRELGVQPVSLIVSAHRAPQIPDPDPPIHDLVDDEFIEEIQKLNGTPLEVFESPEILSLVMPMLRADFCMTETYQYREDTALDCRLRAYGGEEDDEVIRSELEPWREQASGDFELRMFPGGHFFIHHRHSELMAALRAELETVLRGLAT